MIKVQEFIEGYIENDDLYDIDVLKMIIKKIKENPTEYTAENVINIIEEAIDLLSLLAENVHSIM